MLPVIDVWASRTGTGIVGASTSVITADEIARSPGLTIQDVLSREVGVQTWSTTGGNNGATTTVDLRGFGATASSNTLFLLNGRRLNDIDLLGVDLSTIPKDSSERIEISRGNSGAVLYGGGAVGGVVNIITKTGVALPPTARIEGGFGSFNQREINGSAAASSGPFAASVFANGINSDGYRVNSALRERSAIGDLRYTGNEGKAWAVISGDDQHLGLPGARLVDQAAGINQLVTDRRGATTPTAFADKTGGSLTLGVSRIIGQGVELIVDGNLRRKNQTAFSTLFGFDTSDVREMTTASITPRAIIDSQIFGIPTKITTGVDYYDSTLEAKRSVQLTTRHFTRTISGNNRPGSTRNKLSVFCRPRTYRGADASKPRVCLLAIALTRRPQVAHLMHRQFHSIIQRRITHCISDLSTGSRRYSLFSAGSHTASERRTSTSESA